MAKTKTRPSKAAPETVRREPVSDSRTMYKGLQCLPEAFPDDKALKKTEQTKYFLENTKGK